MDPLTSGIDELVSNACVCVFNFVSYVLYSFLFPWSFHLENEIDMSFICLFACFLFFCTTDCGEGSREGRSWTAGQKESQLWEEEKLQVRHCCRFLRRNLIRKVSRLLSLFCAHSRIKQFGNNNQQESHWKMGGRKMRVNSDLEQQLKVMKDI